MPVLEIEVKTVNEYGEIIPTGKKISITQEELEELLAYSSSVALSNTSCGKLELTQMLKRCNMI